MLLAYIGVKPPHKELYLYWVEAVVLEKHIHLQKGTTFLLVDHSSWSVSVSVSVSAVHLQ